MKIKVIKQNEFNVLFEMIDDGLPNAGEYHLVPVGKEYVFVAEHVEYRYRELRHIDAGISIARQERKLFEILKQEIDIRFKQIEQTIELLKGKSK